MNRTLSILVWGMVSLLAALAIAVIAVRRSEPINALWMVTAATCCYALGYRFYSKFIAAKILAVDALRATPAERLENGRDFLVTNKWVVFGHHFAAIAGPGPLVGPVLAAQFLRQVEQDPDGRFRRRVMPQIPDRLPRLLECPGDLRACLIE